VKLNADPWRIARDLDARRRLVEKTSPPRRRRIDSGDLIAALFIAAMITLAAMAPR